VHLILNILLNGTGASCQRKLASISYILDSRFRGNCHGGFPTTEYENFRDFPSAAQDSLHVGGGLKSALKEKGAVFWEMTACVKYFLPP